MGSGAEASTLDSGSDGALGSGGVATGGGGGTRSSGGAGGTNGGTGGVLSPGTGGSFNTGGLAATGGIGGTGGSVIGTGGLFATGGATATGGAEAGTIDAGPVCDGTLSACPSGLPGPTLVAIPASCPYCMDSTEVTNSQYAVFLQSVAEAGAPSQDAWCMWNTSFVPGDWATTTGKGNYPVENMDWCDASAYCKWAKKRLCGKIGGGPLDYGDFADATKSEWFNACSMGGTRLFPYGNQYSKAACTCYDSGGLAATPVGSRIQCEGGYAGIYDLTGNVSEFEDACTGAAGANDTCQTRGGFWLSFGNPFDQPDNGGIANMLRCDSVLASARRGSTKSGQGFRCCADAI